MSVSSVPSLSASVINSSTANPDVAQEKAMADRDWDSNTQLAAAWKDEYGSSSNSKSAFEGFEEWMNQQAINVIQECASDMQDSGS